MIVLTQKIKESLLKSPALIQPIKQLGFRLFSSPFKDVEKAPEDPTFSVKDLFHKSGHPRKINLSIGAVVDEHEKPIVLQVVREVERDISGRKDISKSYLSIDGSLAFYKEAEQLILKTDNEAIKEGKVCTVQTLSGTSALRVTAEFIHSEFPDKSIYMSEQIWTNCVHIFEHSGVPIKYFRYLKDPITLDFPAMCEDLEKVEEGSFVLLQTPSHNPTGLNLSNEQWVHLADLFIKKKLIPVFDCKLLGVVSGDLDLDAFAPRHFVEKGINSFIIQSFSENMTLYAERIGALSVIASTKTEAQNIRTHLKAIIRAMYSNPPSHEMAERTQKMRELLYKDLIKSKTPGDWEPLKVQKGLFSYLSLKKEQIKELREKYGLFLSDDGRICMSAINNSNVNYIVYALGCVITGEKNHNGMNEEELMKKPDVNKEDEDEDDENSNLN
ncbi:aspartate aminotransferase [Anaeramoeba ignava]|uniref:Aspartate aminotransferase n=1 Tax=Anaeramoeba ignava TaxID=1746090 RepID=A0A9Q0LVF9_ANAIG|nr:aspartate aminotransferase [Anaeramoeba ignava]